jgi:hypothetical protein
MTDVCCEGIIGPCPCSCHAKPAKPGLFPDRPLTWFLLGCGWATAVWWAVQIVRAT